MQELKFTNEHDHPVNLQFFLMKEKNVSRKLITKLKRQYKGITRNDELIRTVDDLMPGETVVLHIEDEQKLEPNGELSVPVVYEDDSFVVFNKPQMMPVHPSINHYYDTLGNYFAYRYPGITFRAVNRLDRNTSGLCIAAKDQHSAFRLQKCMKKVYFAVVCGEMRGSGTIDAPIARKEESLITRCVREDGQNAVTDYKVISTCGKYSFVRVELRTGRTHQIRVHFSHIGHPLAGDDLYGGCCDDISCQALHCGEMTVDLPDDGKVLSFSAPVNENMEKLFSEFDFTAV